MNIDKLHINHIAYHDIPENLLLAFILLRDLQDSQEEFDRTIFALLDETIDSLPLFELPSSKELLDLTELLEGAERIGNKFILRN